MRFFGITAIVIWVSITYTLYPIPNSEISKFENFLYQETETYLELLDENEKSEFLENKSEFLASKLADARVQIWTIWLLKVIVILLGVIGGYLLYAGKTFRAIVSIGSLLYLYAWIVQLSERMSGDESSWLASYSKFLADGSFIGKHSLTYQFFFYHQFLILPILHVALIAFCIFFHEKQSQNAGSQDR